MLKQIAKYALTFLGIVLFFNVSMYLVCLFDSERLDDNARQSCETILNQDAYPVLCYPLDIKNDNITDALMINEMVSVNSTTPYESYMKIRKNFRAGQTTQEIRNHVGENMCTFYDEELGQERCASYVYCTMDELRDFLAHRNHIAIGYGRYWHGYLTIFRPMLLWLNVTQMRAVLLGVFIALYALLMRLTYKRLGRDVTVIFGASLLCCGYFSAYFSLQGAPVFLVMAISAIFLLWRWEKLGDFGLFVFAVGCFANFVDYLTVPPLTLGVLSALYLLRLQQEGREWNYCLKALLGWSFLWVLGYAGVWVWKWLQYDLTIHDGPSMVSIALQQCLVRMSRQNSYDGPYGNNYFYITLLVMGKTTFFTMITALVMLTLRRWHYIVRGFNKSSLPFFVLATYPIIWFFVLANHIIYHYFFAYRLFTVYMLGLLLAMCTLDCSAQSDEADGHSR